MSVALIVHDEPQIRELAADVVRAAGYQAISAANGEEAASMLDTFSGIDLIVTELTMTIMDGHHLIGMIRRLVDSHGVPPDVAFLQKPFTVAMLSRAITGCKRLRLAGWPA